MYSKEIKKVAVGMSGGIDSTMSAYLLQQQGLEVVGITMLLWREDSSKASAAHLERARLACAKLGIEHHAVTFYDEFNECIVKPFINSYLQGETPSPCVRCNHLVKFGLMLNKARQLGCSHLATGHYLNIKELANGRLAIQRGADLRKDQSYFLFELTQDQLSHALFPLANKEKRELKKQGIELGLLQETMKESQDLCFIPNGDYGSFICNIHPNCNKPGNIIDLHGKVLGKHKGTIHYTIGQRKGLGLSLGPWFVINIDPQSNEIVVGERQDIQQTHCILRDCNWQALTPKVGDELLLDVQLRYNMRAVPATVKVLENNQTEITTSSPVFAISPGQATVFYQDNIIAGGGWICNDNIY